MAKLVIGTTKTNGVPAVVVGSAPNLGTKTVTANGTYNAATDNLDGYSSVTVNVPGVSEPYRELMVDGGQLKQSTATSRIVNIMGATTAAGFVLAGAYNSNSAISGAVDLHTLVNLPYDYSLYMAFRNCPLITSVDLSGLYSVTGNYTMSEAFNLSVGITSVDLSVLERINGTYSMRQAFRNTGITTLDLSSLTEILGQNCCQQMFYGCTALTSVDVSALTTITGYNACQNWFAGCTALASVTFTALTNLNNGSVLDGAFSNCTALQSLSFPALTSTSFGTYKNQFSNMLSGVTGCTIHFPANLDPAGGSTVISALTGYPNFGGSSTQLSFDLTATN